jgi:hypothetical protein
MFFKDTIRNYIIQASGALRLTFVVYGFELLVIVFFVFVVVGVCVFVLSQIVFVIQVLQHLGHQRPSYCQARLFQLTGSQVPLLPACCAFRYALQGFCALRTYPAPGAECHCAKKSPCRRACYIIFSMFIFLLPSQKRSPSFSGHLYLGSVVVCALLSQLPSVADSDVYCCVSAVGPVGDQEVRRAQ